MKLKACSIYDSKSQAWMTPMFFQATAQAMRSFGDAINDGKSEFAKHPEDYTLFEVGEFDPQNGIMDALNSGPVVITQAVNLLNDATPSMEMVQ